MKERRKQKKEHHLQKLLGICTKFLAGLTVCLLLANQLAQSELKESFAGFYFYIKTNHSTPCIYMAPSYAKYVQFLDKAIDQENLTLF